MSLMTAVNKFVLVNIQQAEVTELQIDKDGITKAFCAKSYQTAELS